MSPDLKLDNAISFRRVVVEPDYLDYKSDPVDLRRACHLALSLFHLRDWTFEDYHRMDSWKFGSTQNAYQAALEARCREFEYIRDVANAVKHFVLKRPSTQMAGAKDVVVAGAAFEPSAFEASAFQTKSAIVLKIAPNQAVDFECVADKAKTMWDDLFEKEGWR